MASPDDRRTAMSIIAPTAERHGFTIIDAEELRDLRIQLAACRAALELLLCEPTDEERAEVRRLLAKALNDPSAA